MRKHTSAFVIGIFLICLLLSACQSFDFRDYILGMWDSHQGERPTDHVPSKWTSTDPGVWFEVLASEDDNSMAQSPINGEAVSDNGIIEIKVHFDGGRSIFIYNAESEGGLLLKGTCKFDTEKLMVTVDKETDTLFNGEYDTITFVRNPTE